MPHHQWIFSGFYRNLVEYISVVAMKCLASRSGAVRVKGAQICDDFASNGKASLLLEDQRRLFVIFQWLLTV